MLVMWITDLTMPDKPRVFMGKSGYASVEEMQNELIRRRPRISEENAAIGITTEAIDRIENGVIVWRWSWAMEKWRPYQQVTLEHY